MDTLNINDVRLIPIPEPGYMVIGNAPRSSNLVFMNEQGEIGKLSWDNGRFTFEGNADESAQQFFNYLKSLFETARV